MAATYGWGKLGLGHRFPATAQDIRYTISEPVRRQVRARLLELNHVRYAEEAAAGLHDKKKEREVRCASRASTVRERGSLRRCGQPRVHPAGHDAGLADEQHETGCAVSIVCSAALRRL